MIISLLGSWRQIIMKVMYPLIPKHNGPDVSLSVILTPWRAQLTMAKR